MHFSLALLTIALTGLTAATPIVDARQSEPTSTVSPPSKYYLKSKVVPGYSKDTGSSKDNLYIVSYHTGAGLGLAAGTPEKPDWWAYSNGSEVLFDYTSSNGPWPLRIVYGEYQSFNELSISVSSSDAVTNGFFFNETGLQYEYGTGWLICDWWLSYPQLFIINEGYNVTIPDICSQVYLLPEAYD